MTYNSNFLCQLYQRMISIRLFEERVGDLFLAGEVPGFVHLYIGQGAIATGVCANLEDNDYVASTHRGHGHCIAKGAQLGPMMAEIFGKKTGYCKGKGGSMHIADFNIGMLGANGVVGGGCNLAVGAALAANIRKTQQVAVCFFGDGASNRGTFHEGMNMAAVWKLPVVFVCENNQWASTTPYRTTTSVEDIACRAAGYGIPGAVVETGSDVFSVYEAAKIAVERARSGGGPTLLEVKTYRIKGHFVGDPELYRSKKEVEKIFKANDPINHFVKVVLKNGWLKQKELDGIKAEAMIVLDQAVEKAREDPYPDERELFTDLYIESEACQ